MTKKTTKHKPKLKGGSRKPFAASAEVCAALEKIGTMQSVLSGTILFRQGDVTNGVYLVLNGRVALSSGDDPVRITRVAEKGSLLGLPATIRKKPYSLTAEAVTDVDLCLVTAEQFRELLSKETSLGLSVVAMLAEEVLILRKLAVYKA